MFFNLFTSFKFKVWLFKKNSYFSAISQIWSTPISFLSLSLASVKLFYSQRLGRFYDADPNLKMVLFALPFIVGLIIGPIYSLLLMAAYLQGYVFVLISTIIVANFIILKCLSNKNWIFPDTEKLYIKRKKGLISVGAQVFILPNISHGYQTKTRTFKKQVFHKRNYLAFQNICHKAR